MASLSNGAARLTRDAIAIADDLRPTILRLHRQLRRQTNLLGISPLNAMLLGLIWTKPGIGITELAAEALTRTPTMSGHIKRLEEDGLIQRRPHDHQDKRRVGLVITAKGRRALDAVRKRRTDWLAGRLRAMPPGARVAIRAAIEPLRRLGQ